MVSAIAWPHQRGSISPVPIRLSKNREACLPLTCRLRPFQPPRFGEVHICTGELNVKRQIVKIRSVCVKLLILSQSFFLSRH
ncbi:hypothetical protein RHEph01_gp002 [Rhizobium phage RHEph01]|uniref:Uncharacterized protein n=1 Tax=Rhizobium phage RHEph01 TaxID=1220601 RepID=L7TJ54_9CAUD|nr:hypothetical protein HOQ88_gp02 [Rhizobium phage RHEph01]AGC35513.1 hypothetical protein RHEph01_gp002 [Rhizobium phage RHEph01]